MVFTGSPKFYFGSVLYDPQSAASRYKMVYWDIQTPAGTSWRVPGLYTAHSDDGIHWTNAQLWGVPKIVGAYGDPGPIPYADLDPGHKPAPAGTPHPGDVRPPLSPRPTPHPTPPWNLLSLSHPHPTITLYCYSRMCETVLQTV